MARRIRYTGDPVLTVEEVAEQCRLEPGDIQQALVSGVIIPGVTSQAETRTGAGIREAEYEEDWPEHYRSGHALDVGQAFEVIAVSRVLPDGQVVAHDTTGILRRGQRESYLDFPAGRPPGVLRIRYKAGLDLEAYPGVRSWMLLNAATAHEFRETLVVGTILAELPGGFMDSFLSEIAVPPRF